MDGLLGKTARVTGRIHGTSMGEVMVSVRQGTERYYAYAQTPDADYPVGSQVLIVDEVGGRTLIVSHEF